MPSILARSLVLLLLGTSAAAAQSPEGTAFDATLAGQAVLPAATLVAAPADAPALLKQAGKFTTPDRKRTSELGAVPGMDGKRPTGTGLPVDGQSVQGFSGIRKMADGTFWSLSDLRKGRRTGFPCHKAFIAPSTVCHRKSLSCRHSNRRRLP